MWCSGLVLLCFFFKRKTAYEVRISDWSSDVCSSDLQRGDAFGEAVDVEADGISVAGGLLVDLLFRRRVLAVVLQQRVGVHADVRGDDHLQPRQADAGVGHLAAVDRALGMRGVHDTLMRRL